MFESLNNVLFGEIHSTTDIYFQDIEKSRKGIATNEHYEVDGYVFAVKFINEYHEYYEIANYEEQP